MELQVGDEVIVRKSGRLLGGEMIGVVRSFEREGHVAVIEPREPALKAWYPKGYPVGRAHWGTVVVRVSDQEPANG